MKATPGRSSATVDWLPAPAVALRGWPAPFATAGTRLFAAQVVMSLPLALAMADDHGTIVIRNEAFRATIGEHDGGDTIESIVVADARASLREAFEVVKRTRETTEIRAAVPGRPDEKQAITIQALPPGLGFSILISLRDIREQLRVQAQAVAATRMQAVGQLAGGIAHDFNNILTAVLILNEQLLARHPLGDEDHEPLAEIRRNGHRAAALVEQLLAFARQQPQRQQLLGVAALIEGLRALIVQLVGPGVTLVVDTPAQGSAVLADPGQIEQVIVNLAVNARDAMAGNGVLTIRLSMIAAGDIAAQGHRIIPATDHIRLDIVDTGAGIPPEIAGKIFEPFFTTKPMGQGTGLGLSTVYGIVKQSNGFVFATPACPGPGTIFSVYLPSVPPPLTSVKPMATVPRITDHGRLAGVRVLLVEDDAAIRIAFERALQRFGLAVLAVSSADPALDLLASDHPFDVLVSDVMMPGVDGVELTSRARLMRPGLAVVLMSGYSELPLHRAADAQGVRFIAKPFSLLELLDAIDEVVLHAV